MNQSLTISRDTLSFLSLVIAIGALPFSIKVCHGGMLMFLLLWLSEGNWQEKIFTIRHSVVIQLFIGLFIAYILSSLWSNDLANTRLVFEKKIFFFTMPIALATTRVRFNTTRLRYLFYTLVIACFAGSVICVANGLLILSNDQSLSTISYISPDEFRKINEGASKAWFLFSYASLSQGIDIHPTFFSLYLGCCIVFMIHTLLQIPLIRWQRFLLWTLTCYFSVFVILLSSRIIILTLVLVLLATVIHQLFFSRITGFIMAIAVLTVLIVSLVFVNPVSHYRNIKELAATSLKIGPDREYKNSTQIRASLWWLAVQSLTIQNVLTGSGTGRVKAAMKQTSDQYKITNVLNTYDPHNQYLYTLLELGIIGLLLLIAIIALPAYLAWMEKDYVCVAFIFFYATLCITESALEVQKGIAFFAIGFPLLAFHRNMFQRFTFFTRSAVHANQ